MGQGKLIVDAVFSPHYLVAVFGNIRSREAPFLPILVIKGESAVQLQIVVWIAEAAIAVAVPQNAVILVADNERYAHFCVILKKVFVLSFHVQLFALMLSESVESLIGRAVEQRMPRPPMFLGFGQFAIHADFPFRNGEGLESLAFISCLCQQQPTVSVIERDAPRSPVHHGLHAVCLHSD